MVLVGSTLNRLFITSPIFGREELPLVRVCFAWRYFQIEMFEC